MPAIEENYDVVVVGAGHAGCERHWHVQGLDWKQLFYGQRGQYCDDAL